MKEERPKETRPALVRADEELRRSDRTWKITAPIQVILVVGMLVVGGVLSVVAKKPTESVMEKRELASMPEFSALSLADGSYTRQVENHYTDTFPLRDQLVRAAADVSEHYGVRADEGRIHTVADAGGGQPVAPVEPDVSVTPPPAADPPPASSAPESTDLPPDPAPSPSSEPDGDEQVTFNQSNTVFVYRGDALSLFGTGSDAPAEYYASQLNQWQEVMGPETTIYNLVAPTHIEFVTLPERLESLSSPQKPNIDTINANLAPSIKAVDAWSKLNEHRDEYLYFHTDHHWTGLGAYYAYTAFCEQAGFTPVPLSRMEQRTIPDYIGSLYAQTQDSSLLGNPDHIDYWIQPTAAEVTQYRRGSPFYGFPSALLAESAKSYSVFLCGDYPLTKIVTQAPGNRKLAVIKESFGNAIVPFLVNHYAEIYVIDQRYFELNLPAFLKENGVNEILFINNIFAANTYIRMNELARLRTQVWAPPAPVEPEPEEEPPSSSESSASDGKPHARKRQVESRPERKNEFEKEIK